MKKHVTIKEVLGLNCVKFKIPNNLDLKYFVTISRLIPKNIWIASDDNNIYIPINDNYVNAVYRYCCMSTPCDDVVMLHNQDAKFNTCIFEEVILVPEYFSDTQSIWEYLIAGGSVTTDKLLKSTINPAVNLINRNISNSSVWFNEPTHWKPFITVEKEYWDGYRMCKVGVASDLNKRKNEKYIYTPVRHYKDSYIDMSGIGWVWAEPATEDEIKKYMGDPKLSARDHLESAQIPCAEVNTPAREQDTPYKTTHIYQKYMSGN